MRRSFTSLLLLFRCVPLHSMPPSLTFHSRPEPLFFCRSLSQLPWSFGDDDLSSLFKGMSVSSSKIQMGFDGRSRGYGIVSFGSVDEASRAIDFVNGHECEGRTVSVRFDRGN